VADHMIDARPQTGTAPDEQTEMRYPTRASELDHRRLQVPPSLLHDSSTNQLHAGAWRTSQSCVRCLTKDIRETGRQGGRPWRVLWATSGCQLALGGAGGSFRIRLVPNRRWAGIGARRACHKAHCVQLPLAMGDRLRLQTEFASTDLAANMKVLLQLLFR